MYYFWKAYFTSLTNSIFGFKILLHYILFIRKLPKFLSTVLYFNNYKPCNMPKGPYCICILLFLLLIYIQFIYIVSCFSFMLFLISSHPFKLGRESHHIWKYLCQRWRGGCHVKALAVWYTFYSWTDCQRIREIKHHINVFRWR